MGWSICDRRYRAVLGADEIFSHVSKMHHGSLILCFKLPVLDNDVARYSARLFSSFSHMLKLPQQAPRLSLVVAIAQLRSDSQQENGGYTLKLWY